jgi:hypothetical protein
LTQEALEFKAGRNTGPGLADILAMQSHFPSVAGVTHISVAVKGQLTYARMKLNVPWAEGTVYVGRPY